MVTYVDIKLPHAQIVRKLASQVSTSFNPDAHPGSATYLGRIARICKAFRVLNERSTGKTVIMRVRRIVPCRGLKTKKGYVKFKIV